MIMVVLRYSTLANKRFWVVAFVAEGKWWLLAVVFDKGGETVVVAAGGWWLRFTILGCGCMMMVVLLVVR